MERVFMEFEVKKGGQFFPWHHSVIPPYLRVGYRESCKWSSSRARKICPIKGRDNKKKGWFKKVGIRLIKTSK